MTRTLTALCFRGWDGRHQTDVRKVSRIQAFLEASAVRGSGWQASGFKASLTAGRRACGVWLQSEEDLLEGLSDLSALHVSLEVLERSGVGATVNGLRKSEFASVATKALAMVKVRTRAAGRCSGGVLAPERRTST